MASQSHPSADKGPQPCSLESRSFAPRGPSVASELPITEVMSAAVGVGVTQFFNWLSNRAKAKSYAMGAVDHAVQTAFGGMETAVGGLQTEVARLTLKVEAVDKKHEDCEAELTLSKAERAELRVQIDDLLSARIPPHVAIARMQEPK